MTQVLNNSVSLSNLNISPRNFNFPSTNSTPVKSTSDSIVCTSNNKNCSKTSMPTRIEIHMENSQPDPVLKKKKKIV